MDPIIPKIMKKLREDGKDFVINEIRKKQEKERKVKKPSFAS
jgi:hypothetical protein